MEQRRVRLGDIVDDYCTRERRLTNHAVVAMVEGQIHLTRCTTCDTEHSYKAAKVPRRRKKTEAGALYEQVLAGRDAAPAEDETRLASPATEPGAAASGESSESAISAGADAAGDEAAPESAEDAPAAAELEDGPVRRPLIRATLPRPEGQQVARPLPDFTIRQAGGRGSFRGDQRGGRPASNGSRPGQPGGQPRHGHRSGSSQGRSGMPFHQAGPRQDRQPGQRHNRPAPHARSGKKRSH